MSIKSEHPATYVLNIGERPPVHCIDGVDHAWKIISYPTGCGSGWYVEQCRKCGIKQEYDTSNS